MPGRPGAGWSGDATLALAVGVIQIVATTFAAERQSGREPLDMLGYALLAAGPVALLVRRRHPVPVLGVAFVATLSYWLAGYPKRARLPRSHRRVRHRRNGRLPCACLALDRRRLRVLDLAGGSAGHRADARARPGSRASRLAA